MGYINDRVYKKAIDDLCKGMVVVIIMLLILNMLGIFVGI